MGKKNDIAVKVDNVSIKFNLRSDKLDTLKEYVVNIFRKRPEVNTFWGLKNVSF